MPLQPAGAARPPASISDRPSCWGEAGQLLHGRIGDQMPLCPSLPVWAVAARLDWRSRWFNRCRLRGSGLSMGTLLDVRPNFGHTASPAGRPHRVLISGSRQGASRHRGLRVCGLLAAVDLCGRPPEDLTNPVPFRRAGKVGSWEDARRQHIEMGCTFLFLITPTCLPDAQGGGVREPPPKEPHPPFVNKGGDLGELDFSLFKSAPPFNGSKAFFTTPPSSTGFDKLARMPWPWAAQPIVRGADRLPRCHEG